jgi:hypothetical protein
MGQPLSHEIAASSGAAAAAAHGHGHRLEVHQPPRQLPLNLAPDLLQFWPLQIWHVSFLPVKVDRSGRTWIPARFDLSDVCARLQIAHACTVCIRIHGLLEPYGYSCQIMCV